MLHFTLKNGILLQCFEEKVENFVSFKSKFNSRKTLYYIDTTRHTIAVVQ